MKNKTYVLIGRNEIPKRQFFHAYSKNEAGYEDQFKVHSKYPKKYLIWHVLDSCGNVSEPFLAMSLLTKICTRIDVPDLS